MNRIKKIVPWIRVNPKKSIFFSLVASYGASLYHQRYTINNFMRVYCEEAAHFSEKFLGPFEQPRHVTVILNPMAKGRKSKDVYEKYVAPILNSSGVKVSLIITESEGQAKELMEIMENTDAVIVAGGSGTIHEAVTGMLRRKDKRKIPLGIIPMGKLNSTAFKVHDYDLNKLKWSNLGNHVGTVKAVAESTIAVVRETLKKINVLEIEAESRKKTVYALNAINFGSLRDIVSNCDKYWYLGNSMKPYLALTSKTLFQDLKNLALPIEVKAKITEPCNGCSKCSYKYDKVVKEETKVDVPKNRWWSSFSPKSQPVKSSTEKKEEEIDYDTIENENCGIWTDLHLPPTSINIVVENTPRDHKAGRVLVHAIPETKGSLITDAGLMFRGRSPQEISQVVNFGDMQLQLRKKDGDLSEYVLEIDGEVFEADNLNIKTLPEKITIYSKP